MLPGRSGGELLYRESEEFEARFAVFASVVEQRVGDSRLSSVRVPCL